MARYYGQVVRMKPVVNERILGNFTHKTGIKDIQAVCMIMVAETLEEGKAQITCFEKDEDLGSCFDNVYIDLLFPITDVTIGKNNRPVGGKLLNEDSEIFISDIEAKKVYLTIETPKADLLPVYRKDGTHMRSTQTYRGGRLLYNVQSPRISSVEEIHRKTVEPCHCRSMGRAISW